MAFATAEQYLSRAPGETAAPATIEVLLSDASVWLQANFADIPDEPQGRLAQVLELVTCAMVRRALARAADTGLESVTDTQGPFSTSYRYANPDGNLFLTSQEREMIDKALEASAPPSFRCITATGW